MQRDDEGQITVLSIGFAVVAIALVFVVVSVSALYLERKTLQAVADMIAVDAASEISDSYYRDPSGTITLTDRGVRATAANYLDAYGEGMGVGGARLADATGSPDGRTAVVTLTMRVDVILIPALVSLPSAVEISATSRARAGD